MCAESVRAFAGVLDRIKASPDAAVDLTGRIAAALADRERTAEGPTRVLSRRMAVGLAAAAAILLTVGLSVAMRSGRPGPGSQTASNAASGEKTVVAAALDWLASTQEGDGSWRAEKWGGQPNFTVGLTALATIALRGGDGKAAGGAYTDTVQRATAYLCAQQSPGGRFGPAFAGTLYNHGIATVALLESYAAAPSAELKPAIDKAVSYLVSHQTGAGGWGYAGSQEGSANTPIAVWQVHALSLARSLGWTEANDATDRGVVWLRSLVDDRGLAGYSAPADFPYGSDALTAMAAFYLMSHDTDAEAAVGRNVMAQAVRTAAARPIEGLDYYRCYFLSYAVRAAQPTGGTMSADYLHDTLVERQLQEGPHSGSWEPNDRWSLTGGRVYATALAALSLEAEQRAPRVIAMLKGDR